MSNKPKCDFQHNANSLCENDAVIYYDGLHRCTDHADPNVVALRNEAADVIQMYFLPKLMKILDSMEPKP